MGRGALYHHIDGKEQLLFKISIQLLEPMISHAESVASDPALTPEQKILLPARALVNNHATHRDAWSVALQETRALTPVHRAAFIEARDAFEAQWRRVLQQGHERGWRELTTVDVKGILGMYNYTARWMSTKGPLTPEEIADRYTSLVLDGLRGGGARSTEDQTLLEHKA